jgi:pimeloyl-ACP methyl ester carboxylesterase
MAPADRTVLARPDVRAVLAEDLREALRQGVDAILRDLVLFAKPWQLEWRRATCPVMLWHGADDWLIPPSASQWLARMIPQARLQVIPNEGHFLVFDRWPEICAWLANDISR